jgi:hypothetical protein
MIFQIILPKIILPVVFFNEVEPTLSTLAPSRRHISDYYENKLINLSVLVPWWQNCYEKFKK